MSARQGVSILLIRRRHVAKQIDINLPVRNLEGSKAFFASLGFGFNPQFTNDDAACRPCQIKLPTFPAPT